MTSGWIWLRIISTGDHFVSCVEQIIPGSTLLIIWSAVYVLHESNTGCGKKTSPIWRGRCVSCGGDTAAEGVSIDSG
jgi:hypothetical protein